MRGFKAFLKTVFCTISDTQGSVRSVTMKALQWDSYAYARTVEDEIQNDDIFVPSSTNSDICHQIDEGPYITFFPVFEIELKGNRLIRHYSLGTAEF
jgi:hypothetical protein